ncbi:MAG: AmpG family muropeptide MFS transporter [Planctomycetes bacterium]|nr:AmpG family muropeptide MFS transporter [Planctomycetota bacterium]
MAAVLLLGFSSGLPLALTGDTLALWLTDHGMKLAEIGAFAAVGTPYMLKFLWAPFLDRFAPPVLGRLLGARRGWIVAAQLVLAVATIALASCDPAASIGLLASAAIAVAFASATQDIVIDAWRTETLREDEAAPGASVHVTGYRIGMLASGAGALLLRGPAGFSWSATYLACGALLTVGLVGAFLAPSPERTSPPATIADAVVLPFREFWARRGAWFVLAFILLFKLPDVIAGAMTMPFLRQTGIPLEQIASVRQGLGVFVTIAGTLAGGFVAARVGLRRALWIYGILQAVSNLAFWGLAVAGPSLGALTGAVIVENFCAGLVTAGFLGFLQRQCSPALAATQFALLTSLMALPRTFVGAPAGWLADRLGWPAFFAVSALFGIPGLLLLPWLDERRLGHSPDAPAPAPEGAAL